MLSLIAGFALCRQENQFTDEDRFGKKPDEVVAMGREAWNEWYTDETRAGQSTMGITFGEMIFADSQRMKNKEGLAALPGERRTLIEVLDQGFNVAVNECVTAGSALTGGGTMWNILSAGAHSNRAEAVRDLVWPNVRERDTTQKRAWLVYRQAAKTLEEYKSEIESYAAPGSPTFDEAVAALGNARAEFAKAIEQSKGSSSETKTVVFSFYEQVFGLVTIGS